MEERSSGNKTVARNHKDPSKESGPLQSPKSSDHMNKADVK